MKSERMSRTTETPTDDTHDAAIHYDRIIY